MKYFVAILLTVFTLNVWADVVGTLNGDYDDFGDPIEYYPNEPKQCGFMSNMSEYQQATVIWAYNQGKLHNFGYTMAAIAFKESSAGLWNVNVSDPSAGVMHNNLRYSINHTTYRSQNMLAMRLILDPWESARLSIKHLNWSMRMLKRKDDFSWKNLWSAYNGGSYYYTNRLGAIDYGKKIHKYVKKLLECDLDEYEYNPIRFNELYAQNLTKYVLDMNMAIIEEESSRPLPFRRYKNPGGELIDFL